MNDYNILTTVLKPHDEVRVHSRMIDIISATPVTVDSLMKLDLAPEVDVEVRSMGQE